MNFKMQKISPQHLSIIITTSPVQSHPSTDIFDQSMDSINKFACLEDIPLYIMCDGAKISAQDDKYKSGIVTEETMVNYRQYLRRLKQKYSNPNKYYFIERDKRYGFAENIRYAMQNLAKTDHVIIYQHDHVINGYIDFFSILGVMRKYPNDIRYISFMNKSYANVVPKLISDKPMKQFILKMLGWNSDYNVIVNIEELTEGMCNHFMSKYGIPLVPLTFWYDKIHIASRQYYLDVIFNPQGNYDPHIKKFQKTISFVQDSFGHCMKWTILDDPSSMLKFGAYIYWTKQWLIYHNKGRSFITEEFRKQKYIPKTPKQNKKIEQDVHHVEIEEYFYKQQN